MPAASSNPGSADALASGLPITLRDGSPVYVRPIRPEDADELRAGFERLSPESRYRRFLTYTEHLGPAFVRYLTDVDHHDHEALIAVAEDGSGVGVARYVRSASDRASAEAAVTVVDDWQGRGAGTALLALLADRARAEGIERFTALLLASNREMLALFRELGVVRTIDRRSGTIEIEIALPATGTGPNLAELLRGSASGRYAVSPAHMADAPERP